MHTLTSLTPSPETGSQPVLPEAKATGADKDVLQDLRRFHLTGPPAEGKEVWLDLDILPALLHSFRDPARIRTDFPVVLPPLEDRRNETVPSCRSLPDWLGEIGPDEKGSRVLHDNLLRLEKTIRELMAEETAPAEAREVVAEAAVVMTGDLHLDEANTKELQDAFSGLAKKIPEGTRLVPLIDRAPLDLFLHAIRSRRVPAQVDLAGRIRDTAEKARALLEVDALKNPQARGTKLQKSMGDVGSQFFKPSALAKRVSTSGSETALARERRTRLQNAAKQLTRFAETNRMPTLVHDGSLSWAAAERIDGWGVVVDDDPCAHAAHVFDHRVRETAEVLRADRLARLEYDGLYDPARHDPWLAQLGWESFTPEELHGIAPVVVLVSADHIARQGLVSLSRLLLSGRPVQVLVIDQPAENPGVEPGSRGTGYRLETGYLGMGHREAWVQQTSAARPLHMMNGFVRALRGTRPAVHVVASGFGPDGREPRLGAWFYTGAALEGRAHPFFHYDPEAGVSWARRLDFSENPSPAEDWPVYELSVKREAKGKETLNLPFTFADFALLEPAFAKHFRLVPDTVPEEDFVTLDAYLALTPDEAAQVVPYVWGVDGTERLRRLAITRKLAVAARDRLDYWRTLQELAGVRSEYVEEAARKAREEARTEAEKERQSLIEDHEHEMERVRRQAAEEVVNQLTAALLEVDISALPAPRGLAAGLTGRSVDEVAAALLAAIQPETLDQPVGEPGDKTVNQTAAELLKLIDPDRLEENPE